MNSPTHTLGPLSLNLKRQPSRNESLGASLSPEQKKRMQALVNNLFAAGEVNPTEQRAATHWALRAASAPQNGFSHFTPEAQQAIDEARQVQIRLEKFVDQVRNGEHRTPCGQTWAHIVHVGIGGSDLGPRLLHDVLSNLELSEEHTDLSLHFLSNVDYHEVKKTLRRLDPARTLVILVSKSFSTKETLLNADHLCQWLDRASSAHRQAALVGITCQPDKAEAFGILPSQIFGFSENVGGRFSLWGPVSACIRLIYGNANFNDFLQGGFAVDQNLQSNAPEHTLPGWLAVADFENLEQGIESLMFSPYDSRLALLVPYLQQLWMESLGKGVTLTGQRLEHTPCPLLWGDTGTNSQHAFFQMLHQSAFKSAIELLAIRNPDHDQIASHHTLLSHYLAQGEAFYNGKLNSEAELNDPSINHKTCPGKHPVHMLVLDRLTPHTLGYLLATWEHRTTLLAALQNINPFDQWGVELGKIIAEQIEPCWTNSNQQPTDSITRHWLQHIKNPSENP